MIALTSSVYHHHQLLCSINSAINPFITFRKTFLQLYHQHQEEKRRRQQREELIMKHLRRHISVTNGDVGGGGGGVVAEGRNHNNNQEDDQQQEETVITNKIGDIVANDRQTSSVLATISTAGGDVGGPGGSTQLLASGRVFSNSLLTINEQLNPCAFMAEAPRPRFNSDEHLQHPATKHSAASVGDQYSPGKNLPTTNRPGGGGRLRSNTTAAAAAERRRAHSTSNTANLTKHVLMKYNPQLFIPTTHL